MLAYTLKVYLLLTIATYNPATGWNFPDDSPSRESSYESYVDDIISRGIANLTLSINKVLCNDRSFSGENIIFSPLSITGTLALLLLGATGSTEDELVHVLGLISGTNIYDKTLTVHEHLGSLFSKLQRTSDSIQLNVANGIFVRDDFPIRHSYKDISEILYKSEILNCDFQTRPKQAQDVINAWVSEKTNTKIKTILDEVPSSYTKLIIVSALYFKGMWEFPFFDRITTRRPFYVNGRHNQETVMVDMMSNGGRFPYYKNEFLKYEVLGFPYKENSTTMYVVMPFDSDIQNLKKLENSLTPLELNRMVKRTAYMEAVILFPKMHLESTIDLRSTFINLGVHSLFDPSRSNLALIAGQEEIPPIKPQKYGRRNDFEDFPLVFNRFRTPHNFPQETFQHLRQLTNSNLRSLRNPGLYADKVVHKTYMDITESGTEAAAATSVSLTRGGGKVVFRVDVPFIFFIRDDRTGVILFWGTIYKPTPNF